MILSRLKQGLKNCLQKLEIFNSKLLLEVNHKKTKIMIFQKTGKKAKNICFSSNNQSIEVVQEYTYLGVKITTSGNFHLYQKTLAEKGLNALYKIYKHIDFFQLSLRSANKIFDTAIVPILTYGAEIWGMFSKLDFEKWDKRQSEKVHLRYCKLFLGLNRKASNYAARGEMGQFPLQLIILKQILKYNLYLNSKEDSSIVKQSLYISDEINTKCTNSYGYFLQDLLKSHVSNRIKTTKHLTEDNIVDFISALKKQIY